MPTMKKSRVFLALGGNLGEPQQAFNTACRELQKHPCIDLLSVSSLYRSSAVGGPAGQPDYLNAVIELETELSPAEILNFCHFLEQEAGRSRKIRWEARTLDLDLLFFDQLVIETEKLSLPHPRLAERHFVLLPLQELVPGLVHPVLQKTVTELVALLPEDRGIKRLKEEWFEI